MNAMHTATVTELPRRHKPAAKQAVTLTEHIIEIVSDSGEGAQRCGQSVGSIAARMGNGVWTVEIIPAEIQPPARSVAGASGNRIRLGSGPITNGGDEADLVVAFNEQVLLGRVRDGELKPGCIILLESMWREHRDVNIRMAYSQTVERLQAEGYRVIEIPMERECLKLVSDARKGKNMWALGMLCSLYSLDPDLGREQVAFALKKKSAKVISANQAAARRRLTPGPRRTSNSSSGSRPPGPPSRRSWSTATPRWRSACWPRAWRSAPCTRSRPPPRCRTT
jgi:2-oxoglutarate/2-oxoacid ferredoxin oxidoreductase subunit alpha